MTVAVWPKATIGTGHGSVPGEGLEPVPGKYREARQSVELLNGKVQKNKIDPEKVFCSFT
jgi:hypothetical protein